MKTTCKYLLFGIITLMLLGLPARDSSANMHEGSHGGGGGKSCAKSEKSCCSGHSKKDESLEDKFYKKVMMIKHHGEEAGLNKSQIQEAKDLKKEVKKMLIKKDAEIEVIKVDIKSGMYEYPVNLEAMNSLIDQKYEIKRQRARELMAAYAKVKSIPSESQWETIKELV